MRCFRRVDGADVVRAAAGGTRKANEERASQGPLSRHRYVCQKSFSRLTNRYYSSNLGLYQRWDEL